MLTSQIDKLTAQAEAAEARDDTREAGQLRDSISTYRGWLDQVQKTLDEFSA